MYRRAECPVFLLWYCRAAIPGDLYFPRTRSDSWGSTHVVTARNSIVWANRGFYPRLSGDIGNTDGILHSPRYMVAASVPNVSKHGQMLLRY